MTEAEAKTKWCPMVRDEREGTRCIGSACMMWREQKNFVPANAEVRFVRFEIIGVYCGLAGKP